MTDTNSKNSGEEGVNKSKKDQGLYTKLVRDFARHKLSDSSSRSTFTTRVRDTDTIDTFLPEIKNYAGGNEDFDGIEITAEKLNYAVLSRETTSYFSTLSNNRQELKDTVALEYDVTQKDFSKKAESQIESLEESELISIIQSDVKRRKFLENVYGEGNIPKEKALSTTLKEFNLDKAYNKISEGEITDFRRSVEKIQLGQKIDTIDLENILGSGVYTGDEQKKILQKILPSMSLGRAKDLGLINNEEAQAFKESIVKKNLSGGSGYIADIARDMKDEDLIFSTDKILDIKDYREKLIKDPTVLQPFIDKYGAFIDGVNTKIEESSIKKSSEFLDQLTGNPTINSRIVGAEKFRVGSIIQIEQDQVDAQGKNQKAVLYGKISGMSEDGKLKITEKGSSIGGEKIYNATLTETSTETYSDFLAFIQKGNSVQRVTPKKITIMTEAELQERIRTGDIKDESSSSIPLIESSDIESQMGDISEQINQKEKELEKQKRAFYIADTAEEKNNIQANIDALTSEIEDLKQQRDKKKLELDSIEVLNVNVLSNAIDNIDQEGKLFGFEAGVTFETKDDIYTIEKIDPITRTVNISGLAGVEEIGFQDFVLNFKTQKAKRVSNSKSMEDIVTTSQKGGDFQGMWKNYVFSDGKIRKKGEKDAPTKSGINYDYLVAGKGADGELVKIEKIEGDHVVISFGELDSKNKKVKNKEGKEKKVTEESFNIFSNLRNKRVHVSYLESYIKRYKLEPRSLNEKNETKKDDNTKDIQKKFHVLSFFFQNISIMEAVKGGQQFAEQIKEIMGQGQEEHALQFANQYLGKLLPKGGRQELQVRLENSQKKRMEEYIERLEKVGSDVATEMIEGYLFDKHGPEYPKEAAVVFMLKKYGVLNAKRLQKFSGTWTWYQALGGKVGDELFVELQTEAENDDLPFTEEYLVYRLMVLQCKPEGYNGIKRRSKLHKEVKKIRATGKEEEYETGKRDGDDERKIEGRVKGGMGELYSNNYPNAVGWMEQVVNKGGSMELMNKMPFVMAFSGIAYDFEQKTTDQIKKFPGGSRVLMMLRFFSLQSDLNILNKAILRVCHILQERGEFSHIGTEADAIFNSMHNSGKGHTVADKLKRTEEFYDKYGKVLTDIMYSLNTSDKNESLSQLIVLEKDKPGNEDLKTYQDMLHAFTASADVNFTDKDLMTDAFDGKGISGLDLHKVTEQNLIMRQGHWTKHESGPTTWEHDVRPMFEALPHKVFYPYTDVNDPENRAIQKKLIKKKLQEFLSGLLKGAGQNQRELLGYNVSTSPFSKLNTWGIDMARIINLPGSISVEGLHHGDDKYQGFLSDFADNIMKVETIPGTDFGYQITGEEGEQKLSIGSSVGTGQKVGDIVNGPPLRPQSRTEKLLGGSAQRRTSPDPSDDFDGNI